MIEHELKENSFPPFFCLSVSLHSFLSLFTPFSHSLSSCLPFYLPPFLRLSLFPFKNRCVFICGNWFTKKSYYEKDFQLPPLSLSLLTSYDVYWNERKRRKKGRKETKSSSSLSCSFNKQHQTFQGSISFHSNFPISIQIYLPSFFLFLFLSFSFDEPVQYS